MESENKRWLHLVTGTIIGTLQGFQDFKILNIDPNTSTFTLGTSYGTYDVQVTPGEKEDSNA